jgi:hypothetical protein
MLLIDRSSKTLGQEGFELFADVNGENTISILDVAKVAGDFGIKY